MDLSLWIAFFAASWAISISPGAGAVAAMSSGLNHGFARGYWLTAGLILGIWTQVLLVGVGLGAVIATSAIAFSAIKWAGVAYLLWLGIAQWRAPATAVQAEQDARAATSRASLVLRGWAVNSVNPKGTLFMLAVMPQFLNPAQPLVPQYLVMAATLAFTDLVVMAGYTALAAKVLGVLREPAQVRWLNRVFGTLFIAAAGLLATIKKS